jgi:tetratricopeptide (TPR) repeat protein
MSGFGREQYFNVRGSILSEQGKYQQALNDFNKAIQINSSLATAYANRAITKINMMANTKTISYSLKLNTKDHQTITPSWSSPAKFSNKKNESTYFAAMADCDRAIELDPKLDNAYYIRGKIKKIIQYGDYCYDLLKAQTLGFPVEQELLTGCK